VRRRLRRGTGKKARKEAPPPRLAECTRVHSFAAGAPAQVCANVATKNGVANGSRCTLHSPVYKEIKTS